MTTLHQHDAAAFPAAIADGVRAAVQATFTAICGGPLTPLAEQPPAAAGPAIVGIISFLGRINWSFSLGLPEGTASALATKFAGFEIPFDSADMCDVVGELANVVAGDIVAQLDARQMRAQMSLPMVARGSDVAVESPGHMPSLHVAWGSPQGPFWYRLAGAKSNALPGNLTGA
jgi:chemotaxis protein CheX